MILNLAMPVIIVLVISIVLTIATVFIVWRISLLPETQHASASTKSNTQIEKEK